MRKPPARAGREFSWKAAAGGVLLGILAVAAGMGGMILLSAPLKQDELASQLNTYGSRVVGVLIVVLFAIVAGYLRPKLPGSYAGEELAKEAAYGILWGAVGGVLLFYTLCLIVNGLTWVFCGTLGLEEVHSWGWLPAMGAGLLPQLGILAGTCMNVQEVMKQARKPGNDN